MGFSLHIINAHNENTGEGNGNTSVVFPAEFFLQEQAAPKNGGHAVRGNDGGSQSGFTTSKGIDICKLTDGFKDSTNVFGCFHLGQQLLLLDDQKVLHPD